MTIAPAAPDLAAVKARQQKTWSSGDYAHVASRIVLASERLADSADLRAGWNVLDVACGSGNTSLAAARQGHTSSVSTTCRACSTMAGPAPPRNVSTSSSDSATPKTSPLMTTRSTRW